MELQNKLSSKVGKIMLFMMLAIGMVGCEDMYTTFPKDELLEEDYWKTESDIDAAVITGYYDLRKLQDELILYGLVRSDIAKVGNADLVKWQKGIFSSEDKICNWDKWYKLIHDMNLVIEKSEEVLSIDKSLSRERYMQLTSEARFLRAFAYFNLIRFWKNVPIIEKASIVDNQDYFPIKSENPKQVLDFIIKDLDTATTYMVTKYKVEDDPELTAALNRGRATRGAAWALMSDVKLWVNDYQGCIEACDKILGNSMYTLMPQERWWDIFDPQKGNSSESVFELNYEENFDYDDRKHKNNSSFERSLEDWFKTFIKVQSLSALWPPPDIRYGTLTGTGGDIARKHVGAAWSGTDLIGENFNPNWIIYRLPHVMYNKVEALNRLKGSAALNEINNIILTIEQRAGVIDFEQLSGGVGEVEVQILEYKLKETAFEGTRWFDLVRIAKRQWNENKTGENNILVRKLTEIAKEEDKLFVKGNLNNPESWYVPISRSELENNINLVQNPYYKNN